MTTTADRLEEAAAHHEALIAVFGSGDGWEHAGIVSDGGPESAEKCACGHPIRYVYHWEHEDGRKAQTGSVCVDHIPGLDPAAVARIKAHAAEIRRAEQRAKRAAKAAQKAAGVQEMRSALEAEIDRRYGAAYRESRAGWVDDATYSRRLDYERFHRAIRAAGTLKSAAGQLGRLQSVSDWLASE